MANGPVEDDYPPQGLTHAKPLELHRALPYPDELRRGGMRGQTPRVARAVLATPYVVNSLKIPPACMEDISPTLHFSRWTGQEPPSPSHNILRTAEMAGPGEYASCPGLDKEGLAGLKSG